LIVSLALHAWFVWGVRVVAPRPATEFGAIRATLAPALAASTTPDRRPARRSVRVKAVSSARSANVDAPGVPAPAPPPPDPMPAVLQPPVPQPPQPDRIEALPELVEMPAPVPESSTFGPALELPLVEDPEFYQRRKLDVPPRPLRETDIERRYPEDAASRELSGVVVLRLLIDELGMVVDASVISADPPGVFDEAALATFRDVMFWPGQRNGRAVKSEVFYELTYDAKVGSLKQ
jgi:periplasmic protein TonB